MKKRCKGCKYFQRYNDSFNVEYHDAHAGTCSNEKFVYDSLVPTDGLRYWDCESYSAGFEVGEEFGCIHWIVK